MKKEKGTFYIVAAPSGCGKSTIVKSLVSSIDNLIVSVSYTTRPIGRGEQDGVDYFFINNDKFQDMENSGEFIESARVFGNRYGTSKYVLNKFLEQGLDVILEIDWQGAKQIKDLDLDCVSVYLLPPSLGELNNRLKKRDREPIAIINRRMQEVPEQIIHCSYFDYIIVNDDFEQAVEDFRAIINVHRMASRYQRVKYKNIIETLLAD
ncbi:MAG: guanylate kinase [Legionellales bacterium]|nr:guanylate kinase [Legionellales bacterium]